MIPLLIIDAGHGGKDQGGGSCEYFTEAAMNLQISLYQYKRCQELGIPAVLTRDSDIYLSPNTRSRIVIDSGAKYCISNHINAADNPQAEGAETIHSLYSDGKLAHAIIRQLKGQGQKVRRVFLRASTKDPKKDYYYMHRLTGDVETVIVEYGFATNDNDKKKIHVLWRRYAEAALRGFCLFHGLEYEPIEEPDEIPDYKQEGMDYLYDEDLLTDPAWRKGIDEPLPRWAIGLILKRIHQREEEK